MMSIRARLSRVENALMVDRSATMKVTVDDFGHLTDEELDRLESIMARVAKISEDDGIPVPEECCGDPRAFIAYMLEHEAEYLAAVQSLADEGRL